MTIPSVQEIEDLKADIDIIAAIANGGVSETVETRLGGTKPSISKAVNDALESFAAINSKGIWQAEYDYKINDVWKYDGDWYFCVEDYTSNLTAEQDIQNKSAIIYKVDNPVVIFESTFGDTESSLISNVSSTGAVVGDLYATSGGLAPNDEGAALWHCAAYESLPTDPELTISSGQYQAFLHSGFLWMTEASDSGNGYKFKIIVNQFKPVQFGLKYNDETVDSYPVLDQIAKATGADGFVELQEGVSYIAGSRVRLQDLNLVLTTKPNSLLIANLNPNVKEFKLNTPLKTAHPTLSRDHTFHKNYNRDWLNALVGASCRTPESVAYNQEGLNFSEDWENWNIAITQEKNSGTAALLDTVVIWDDTFSTGQEGVFTAPRFNRLYETAVVRDSQQVGTPSDSYVSVTVLFGDERLIVAFREDDDTAKVFHINDSGTLTTIHSIVLPSLAYTLNVEGSLTLGFRMVSPFEVEVYANELLIYRCDTRDFTSDEVEHVGYAITPALSTKVRFYHLVAIDNRTPVSRRNVQIGVIGDSQSYGAWSSIDYATFLKQMLEAAAFGDVTIRNAAVSGSSTSSWVNGGAYSGDGNTTTYSLATQDFTNDHYTIVALGTNDAIGEVSIGNYEIYLKAIGDAIVAQGSVPIICSFPTPKISQTNYAKIPEYVAVAKKVARNNGWSFAQNREAFGAKESKFFDSLHPHEVGQVYLASSVYEAITTDKSRQVWPNPLNNQSMSTDIKEFSNGWAEYSGVEARQPSVKIENDTVALSGLISGGSQAVSAFTIPYNLKPKRDIFFPVAHKSDATYPSALIYVSKGGIVQVLGGTLSGTNWWVSLDGVNWDF